MFGLEGPVERWRAIRAEIHDEVCARGVQRGAWRIRPGVRQRLLDASALLIPQVGFLPPDDPRVQGTVAAIERKLLRGGFVLRYDTARDRGRPAARRRRLPAVQLLARRCVCPDRTDRGRAAPVRAAGRLVQRRRPAGGGIRCRRSAPGRQLPAGVLAHRADQHGIQSRSCGQAMRAAFRAQTNSAPRSKRSRPAREPAELSLRGGNARRRTRSAK